MRLRTAPRGIQILRRGARRRSNPPGGMVGVAAALGGQALLAVLDSSRWWSARDRRRPAPWMIDGAGGVDALGGGEHVRVLLARQRETILQRVDGAAGPARAPAAPAARRRRRAGQTRPQRVAGEARATAVAGERVHRAAPPLVGAGRACGQGKNCDAVGAADGDCGLTPHGAGR